MKKIALFIGSLQKGGSERVMANLAEYFYKKGYEVLLVTQYKREVEYDISPKIQRVYSEPAKEQLQGGRIHNFMVRFQTLRNIWKEHQPDVILSFLGKNNLMAIITSRFLPVKVVTSVRGEPTMEYEGKAMQRVAKLLFRFADGVVLQTKMALEFFPDSVRRKAVILPNPLNLNFIREKYQGKRENVIVTAGRLDENKNHKMLIKAFANIAEQYPDTKLVIYGEGENRTKLESLAKEKGLEDRISLPGSVSDLADRMYCVRAFVLTSDTEGMPNSLLEAMTLGLTVISTDCPCGGPATLIKDGENGLLIPVRDEEALTNALIKILSDWEYADKLGNNAHDITKEMHPDKVNSEWEKYLLGIAKK